MDSISDRVAWRTKAASQSQHVTTDTLAWLMRSEDPRQFSYPAAYVELLQRWTEESTVAVKTVKPCAPCDDVAGRRFSVLLRELSFRLTMPPVDIAREAGLYADGLMSRQETVEGDWNSDVGLHFYNSSSLGRKGRVLHAITRSSRSSKYLEVGTAYGMSAFFVGRTLEMRKLPFSITTIEAIEQQHRIATAMLGKHFGESVRGRLGWSKETLSQLAKESQSFDFLFHDAGHSYDDYVNDFALAEPMLVSGAICLIDDIRWDDLRHTGGARCYEGWQAVVAHPRVRAAAELDGTMGIALLS